MALTIRPPGCQAGSRAAILLMSAALVGCQPDTTYFGNRQASGTAPIEDIWVTENKTIYRELGSRTFDAGAYSLEAITTAICAGFAANGFKAPATRAPGLFTASRPATEQDISAEARRIEEPRLGGQLAWRGYTLSADVSLRLMDHIYLGGRRRWGYLWQRSGRRVGSA